MLRLLLVPSTVPRRGLPSWWRSSGAEAAGSMVLHSWRRLSSSASLLSAGPPSAVIFPEPLCPSRPYFPSVQVVGLVCGCFEARELLRIQNT